MDDNTLEQISTVVETNSSRSSNSTSSSDTSGSSDKPRATNKSRASGKSRSSRKSPSSGSASSSDLSTPADPATLSAVSSLSVSVSSSDLSTPADSATLPEVSNLPISPSSSGKPRASRKPRSPRKSPSSDLSTPADSATLPEVASLSIPVASDLPISTHSANSSDLSTPADSSTLPEVASLAVSASSSDLSTPADSATLPEVTSLSVPVASDLPISTNSAASPEVASLSAPVTSDLPISTDSASLSEASSLSASASPQKSSQSAQVYWSGPSLHGLALASVLGALMLTLLLEALDQTIVGTALPKIVAQFQGFDRYTWVGTAYLLASITMIPITGKLSDQFGRKWFFVSGVIVFLLGSFLSGIAQDMNQLIVFRAIQGLGAGMGISLVFAAVGELLPPAERARWQGIFSGVYGFSSVVGPTLGGWLTDHGPLLSNLITNSTRWRWIFYVNLPLGILALITLLLYYPRKSANANTYGASKYRGMAAIRRIDFLGALLIATATICLLLGLTWGSNQIYDWNSIQVISILTASALLYVLFVIRERFAAEPILPLILFKKRVFAADSVLALMIGMILLSLIYYLPLFLQGVLGSTASDSGLVLTPLTISVVIGAATGGILVGRLGRYQGIALVAAIILSIGIFLLSRLDSSTSLFTAGIYMIIAGIGLGVFLPMTNLVGQNAHPRHLIGVSTSAIIYLRSLGQTLGLAIIGTVVTHTINTELSSHLPAAATKQLSPQALKYATDTQSLVNPAYRDTVVKTATQYARSIAQKQAIATAHVPPSPQHDQIVASIGQQAANQAGQLTQTLLNQVFETLRQALAISITRGFLAVLIFCTITFVATLFLKDIPLARRVQAKTEEEIPALVAVH